MATTALNPGYGGDTVSDEDITGSAQATTTTTGIGTVSIAPFTIGVTSTASFPATGSIWLWSAVLSYFVLVTYTGTSGGNTFTGCTVDGVTAAIGPGSPPTAPTWGASAPVVLAFVKLPRSKIVVGASGTDGGDVSTTNPLPVSTADTTNSGALGALNANVQVAVSGLDGAAMQLSAGTLIGNLIAEVSTDGGANWKPTNFYNFNTGTWASNIVFQAVNPSIARAIRTVEGASHVRVKVAAYTSGTANVALRASDANVIAESPTDVTNRPLGGNRTLWFQDIDSTNNANVNTAIWTVTLVGGGTVAGGLILATVAGATDSARITTKKLFPISPTDPIVACVECLVFNTAANTTIRIGTTDAFFKIDGAGVITANYSNASVATIEAVTLGTFGDGNFIVDTDYKWIIETIGYGYRFIVEDFNGNVLATTVLTATLANGYGLDLNRRYALFVDVTNSGASAGVTVIVSSVIVQGVDTSINKDWGSQKSTAAGHWFNAGPTTYAQTTQLAAGAAPTTGTPANTNVRYATLGGEFSLNATAASENLLGVFGYQVPSPFAFNITNVLIPQPALTTALGANIHIQEWCLMVASSNNPSTATGFRNTIGLFSAAASAPAGTVLNGQPLNVPFNPPIPVLPGQFILVLVKIIVGTATGVYRGSVLINGYFE